MRPFLAAFVVGAFLPVFFSSAHAAVPEPVSTPPNKWQYTLFNPVPDDQLRDMDTDRPDKTNTPHTIDAGHVQIESGVLDYIFDRDKYHGDNVRSDAFSFAQENVRIGVLNDLEINLSINLLNFNRVTDFNIAKSTRQASVGDLFIGGNLNLWGNDGQDAVWATSLSIQPIIKLPTAQRGIGNGHFEAQLGFPFLINLPGNARLNAETIVSDERNTANTTNIAGWQNMLVVDRTLFWKLDAYVEYWSHASTERHRQPQQSIDFGVTYPLTEKVTIDTGFNLGLNRVTPSFEWVSGFSVRF